MQEPKTCRWCLYAFLALILLSAGLFAMPFLPCAHHEESAALPPLPSFIQISASMVDPATIGSQDRAEMLYPDD